MNVLKKIMGEGREQEEIFDMNYTAMNIPVEELVVDGKYQRISNNELINEIRSGFDPDLFGYIIVSLRNNTYHVVDGGHRVTAIKGFKKAVPCIVWTGLTYQEEVKKFRKLNSVRLALPASAKFHALVEEGNEAANKVVGIMKDYGFGYNRYSATSKDNIIGSPTKILAIYRDDGEMILRHALSINRKAWHGAKDGLTAEMIVALKTFLKDYPEVNDRYLIKALSTTNPKAIKQMAAIYVTADTIGMLRSGSSRQVHIANTIKDLYNKNLPSKVKAQFELK